MMDEQVWMDDVEESETDQQALLSWIRMCVEKAHDAALRGLPGEAELLLARGRSLAEMMPSRTRDAGDEIFDMGAILVRRAMVR